MEIVDDGEVTGRINDALTAKYAAFRPHLDTLPAATRSYYAKQVFLRFVPDPRILTWDNSRIATGRKR
ncbi:hypothetical protein I553_3164 [Mycobacterium xenopi 4042]|uniref:Uncharacterized protein n=1 Tax=Mycobacterium xenopi 4042 TaxID=1299334 RepID=X8E340_MYCXE|nr:hypothetical protein I553_3164 [Mycobacterium xenopi 4042]